MPNFWLALILIVVFVVGLGWFPLVGHQLDAIRPDDPIGRVLDTAWHLVLPVVTLALTYMALYHAPDARCHDRDAVQRLGPRRSCARACPTAVSSAATSLARRSCRWSPCWACRPARCSGGSVVIETVFSIPGLGNLAYLAVSRRDLPLIAGVILAGTLMVIVINLLVDLSYSRLDPRVADDRGAAPAPMTGRHSP